MLHRHGNFSGRFFCVISLGMSLVLSAALPSLPRCIAGSICKNMEEKSDINGGMLSNHWLLMSGTAEIKKKYIYIHISFSLYLWSRHSWLSCVLTFISLSFYKACYWNKNVQYKQRTLASWKQPEVFYLLWWFNETFSCSLFKMTHLW